MALDKTGKELPKGITWREDKQTYMARFTYQGTPYTFYDKDLRTIKQTLKDKRYEVEHGMSGKADKITLNHWYETWLTVYKIPTIKETSIRTYRNIYDNHIRDTLGIRQLAQIKPTHIQKAYNDLLSDGLSAKYIININSMLYNIMEIAVKNDLIMKNPCAGAVRPKAEKKERRVLSLEEQLILLTYFKKDGYKPNEPLILTLLGTGMRIGEALALTWGDLDFKNKEISINKTLVYIKDEKTQKHVFKFQTPKSDTSKRRIPMQTEVENALKRQRLYQNKLRLYMGSEWQPVDGFTDLVFTGMNGKPKQTGDVQAVLNTVVFNINADEMALAEKERRQPVIMEHVHPHALRHSFATRCFELDVPPKTVQQFLGHSSIQMTMDLYTHVSEEKKRKDIQKLDGIFQVG